MARLCARCGFPTEPGHRVYSRYTKHVFCWDDEDCLRRRANNLTLEEITIMATLTAETLEAKTKRQSKLAA